MTMLKGLGHKSCFEMAEEGCVHMLLHLKICNLVGVVFKCATITECQCLQHLQDELLWTH